MAYIAARSALVEIDRRPVGERDFPVTVTSRYRLCKRWLFQFQMAQKTYFLGNLEMFVFCDLEMAGIAGDLVPIESFVPEVNFMFETDLLCELDFRLCQGVTVVAAGL